MIDKKEVKTNFFVFLVISILLISMPLLLESSEHKYVSNVEKEYHQKQIKLEMDNLEEWKYVISDSSTRVENYNILIKTVKSENIKDIDVSYSQVSYNNLLLFCLYALGGTMLIGDSLYLNSKLKISLFEKREEALSDE